jgi:hypothetical protein
MLFMQCKVHLHITNSSTTDSHEDYLYKYLVNEPIYRFAHELSLIKGIFE